MISLLNGGGYLDKEEKGWLNPEFPDALAVEDPMIPELDVGMASFNVRDVKTSFQDAREILSRFVKKNKKQKTKNKKKKKNKKKNKARFFRIFFCRAVFLKTLSRTRKLGFFFVCSATFLLVLTSRFLQRACVGPFARWRSAQHTACKYVHFATADQRAKLGDDPTKNDPREVREPKKKKKKKKKKTKPVKKFSD